PSEQPMRNVPGAIHTYLSLSLGFFFTAPIAGAPVFFNFARGAAKTVVCPTKRYLVQDFPCHMCALTSDRTAHNTSFQARTPISRKLISTTPTLAALHCDRHGGAHPSYRDKRKAWSIPAR